MSEVLHKKKLTDELFEMKIKLPLAKYAQPGHYIMVKSDKKSNRTPLFVSGNDKRSVTFLFSNKTEEGKKLEKLRKGSALRMVAGLYGQPFPLKEYGNIAWVAENEHIGVMTYLAELLKNQNNKIFMIAAYKNKKKSFYDKRIKKAAHKHVFVTDKSEIRNPIMYELQNLFRKKHIHLFAMKTNTSLMQTMANLSHLRAKTYSCFTPPAGDDGVGISGTARIPCNGEMKLIAVDGPFFDAHKVNWYQIA